MGHTGKPTAEHGLVLGAAGAVSLALQSHRCNCHSDLTQDPAGPYQQYTVARHTEPAGSQLQFHSMLEVKISHLRVGSRTAAENMNETV